MKRTEIDRRVTIAIGELLRADEYLFAQEVNERAIAHQFAVHLGPLFRAWNVDCEYNRYGDALKLLPLSEPCRRLARRTEAVSPDVIVHRRGPNGRNLLAVEIKKVGTRGRNCDLEKLHGYMGVYRYEYGLFLSFRVGATAKGRLGERILFSQT